MRPKSKATVVVVFDWTNEASSIPTPAWVIVSSVLSGRISLTDWTIVVLPTPKPPTITILRPSLALARSGSRTSARSEVLECNEHLLQRFGLRQPSVVGAGRMRRARGDLAGVEEVAEQDLDHADGQSQVRGDLHDRH